MEAELIYFRRRSAEETEAAAAAADLRVRHVHLELARRYAERVQEIESQRLDIPVRLVPAA